MSFKNCSALAGGGTSGAGKADDGFIVGSSSNVPWEYQKMRQIHGKWEFDSWEMGV